MKARQQSALLLIGVLIAALISIHALPATPLPSGLQGELRSRIAQATETRTKYPENHLERKREGGRETLKFGFLDDFNQKNYEFECQIDTERDRKLREQEGFDLCRDRPQITRSLTACYRCETNTVRFNVTARPELYARYMRERGRWCDGRGWDLDYGALIEKAREPLQDCRQQLARVLGDDNREALMAFIFSIPYQKMYDLDDFYEEWTSGLRIPTSVMLANGGDCDSKAALFCSLYSGKRELVIFHSVPGTCRSKKDKDHPGEKEDTGHAMVGIDADGDQPHAERRPDWWKLQSHEIREGTYTDANSVPFGSRNYIPIDATGPGKIKLYEVIRDCDYEAIPIPSLGKSFNTASADACLNPASAPQSGDALKPRQH